MRLQRFLSQTGVASRRKAEELILKGEIRVNDVPVREMGVKVDPEVDRISFRGRSLHLKRKFLYYLLHKPAGLLVTKRDPEGRRTIYDLMRPLDPSLNAVGRLDQESEGLILLTNDGELAYRLTHPSYEIEKTYHVSMDRLPEPGKMKELERGILLEGRMTAPARLRLLMEKPGRWLSIEIHEGKKRQVRRMIEWAGCRVKRLIRMKMGPLELGELPSGKWRTLSQKEITRLRREAGLDEHV
jgi:23S rRNA pseudouridine2605 synthase